MSIKITVMNQETRDVPYKDGMSVGDALAAVNVTVSESDTIFADSKKVEQEEKLNDNTLLVVTPKIKQG